MRRMNLLPAELRPRDGSRPGSAYIVVGVLAASVLGVGAYGFALSGVRADENELASLKEESARAKERANALAPYGEFAAMKTNRERSVQAVADTRFDYERLTRELTRILPQGVSVGHLEVAPAPPTEEVVSAGADSVAAQTTDIPPALNVSGCAPGQDAVADTLDRLHALTGATDVSLGASGEPGAGSSRSSSRVANSACGGGGRVAFDATVVLTAPAAGEVSATTPASTSVETSQ